MVGIQKQQVKWHTTIQHSILYAPIRLPAVYCEGMVPLIWSGPNGRISEVTLKDFSFIQRQYFKDVALKWMISVLTPDESVPLLHGRRFDVYEKCLEIELRFPLSAFENDCLNYFSWSPGHLMPNVWFLLLDLEAFCLSFCCRPTPPLVQHCFNFTT